MHASRTKKISPRKLGHIEYDLLEHASASDILIGFLLSSCSTRIMYSTIRKRGAARQNAKRALNRLSKKGFIELSDDSVQITPLGRKTLDTAIARMHRRSSGKLATWDGRWRLVMFDIPESMRGLRDALRFILKRAGFKQLQQSVWVHSHDCSELTTLLQHNPNLTKRVILATTKQIDREKALKKIFKLGQKNSMKFTAVNFMLFFV